MNRIDNTPGPWVRGHNVSHELTVRSCDSNQNNGFIVAQFFGPDAVENSRLTELALRMRSALMVLRMALVENLNDWNSLPQDMTFAVIDEALGNAGEGL
jgi:hypothetical protein